MATVIDQFRDDLEQYQSSLVLNSPRFKDYRRPSLLLKDALTALVQGTEADTISMMRILVSNITEHFDSYYSDYTIGMLVAATPDMKAKRLIPALVMEIHSMINGLKPTCSEAWLAMVNYNKAVKNFLLNYGESDLSREETYSNMPNVSPKQAVDVVIEDVNAILSIDTFDYRVKLIGMHVQNLSFELAKNLAENTAIRTVESEVTVQVDSGRFILDANVTVSAEAASQMVSLGLRPIRPVPGMPTELTILDRAYRLLFVVLTHNHGESWVVAECQKLPPSMIM